MEGGDEFAAFEFDGAVGVDDELGVVEGAAVFFVDADAEDDVVLDGGLAEGFGEGAGDLDGVFVEFEVGFPGGDGGLDEGEVGVVGDEGFGEDGEFDALGGGIGDGGADFGDGGFPGVEVGGDLDGGGSDDHGIFGFRFLVGGWEWEIPGVVEGDEVLLVCGWIWVGRRGRSPGVGAPGC